MQSQDTVKGQILSYISTASGTPWSGRESCSLQNSSGSRSMSDMLHLLAGATLSDCASPLPLPLLSAARGTIEEGSLE